MAHQGTSERESKAGPAKVGTLAKEVKWVDHPCTMTHHFESKKLMDLGHFKNPALMQRGDMVFILYVLSENECLMEVTNECDPMEGWFYRGPFSSFASEPKKVIENLGIDDAFAWQVRSKVEGADTNERGTIRLKIDAKKCAGEDEELKKLRKITGANKERFVYVELARNPPIQALRAYLIALGMHQAKGRRQQPPRGVRGELAGLEALLEAM